MNTLLIHTITAAAGVDQFETVSVMMVLITFIAFIATWALNRISILRIKKGVDQSKEISAIMQHTLDISHNQVLRLDLRERRAYNLYGNLLPPEGLSHEESFQYIHPDDLPAYQAFIHRLFHGEAELDECTFRWDMSGKAHRGDWRYLRDVAIVEYADESKHIPVHIFSTMIDCTDEVLKEQEEQDMIDKYRQTFEQSIVGLAFYDKDGRMLTANKKMREILRFQGEDDAYYFNDTLYERPIFRDVLNFRHIEELYYCTRLVNIERNVSFYAEIRVHPIYDENKDLLFITLSISDVTQERELYIQNKINNENLRRANEEIQAYESEIRYLMENCNLRFWRTSFAERTVSFYKGLATETRISFDELREHLVKSVFKDDLLDPENRLNVPKTDLCLSHPFFHEGESLQWNIIDSVPYFDEQGKQLGTYGIIRNVTPLIQKQEQLKEETERANDSGRLKSVFMANMTHEIRTPLNSIVGFSDVLPMLSTPEEKQEIIRVIMNNCDMLLRLINDILVVSSMDTGGIRIEPRNVDFAKSFNDICESLKERILEPDIAFIKDNPYQVFETCVDNGRLQQVITNFVTNAVKYTRQGHIRVGYREEPGSAYGCATAGTTGLYIYCEDTGDGIPKEAQGKIFERFVKLNDYIQGTGLGLSICKAIADSCKGKVGVISEGKDKGSTFWLWIPCEIINKVEQ